MSRLLSRAAPQLGLIALCASSVGCLEAPPPDNSYPHVAVSGEVFRVFCRRVAKAGYPLDVDGQRFYNECDGLDADGNPTDPESEPDPGLRQLLRHRPEIMEALEREFGETDVAGGATFADKELSGFLNALVPLYDKPEETIPTATRGIAQLFSQLTDPNDERASKVIDTLVRLVTRKGYRTPEQNLGAIRSLFQYPELDTLARLLLPVVSAGGAAHDQWVSVLNATGLELSDDPVVADDLDLTTLHTALDLLLKNDPTQSTGNVHPAIILQRQKGSGDAIGPAGEGVPTPFAVAGVDDGAERDANGLATANGEPLYQTFDATPTLFAALMRETSWLIGRGDLDRSPLESFAHGFKPLLGPWGARTETVGQNNYQFQGSDTDQSPFLDLVHVFTTVAQYPETETLIKTLDALIRNHETDAMHFVYTLMQIADLSKQPQYDGAKLTGPHEFWDDMVDAALRMGRRPGLFEALMRSYTDPKAAQQGKLFATWMRNKDTLTYQNAPFDPMGTAGAFTAQQATDLNAQVSAPLAQAVDRTQPDVGMNRSIWQRTMSLIHGLNGVQVCNKTNAVLNVPTTNLGVFTFPSTAVLDPNQGYAACDLFQINDAVEIYFLALLGKAPLVVKDSFALALGALGLPLGQVPPVPDIIEQNSQIKGLRDLISPQAMARLLFAPNNKWMGDLYSPLLSVDSVPIKDYEPYALFPMEDPSANANNFSFLDVGVPLATAFDGAELRDPTGKLTDGYMLGNLLSVLHKHWSSRKSDACPSTPEMGNEGCTQSLDPSQPFYSPQTNLVSYEDLIADSLDQQDLVGMLSSSVNALASITVTTPDGTQVDGVKALADFVQRMATPDAALTKRDGSTSTQTNLCVRTGDSCANDVGRVITTLAPLHLFADALKGIDDAFDAFGDSRQQIFHQGRSDVLDKILAVDVSGSGASATYSLHDRTGYNIALAVLPWVIDRFDQHRTAGDFSDWTAGLVGRLQTIVRHPIASGVVDLLDAFWPEIDASGEFTKVVSYLTDESNELAYRTMLTAVADSMTLLDRDANLSPAIQFASLVLAPNAFQAIDGTEPPNADKSVAYAGLELTGGVVKELNKNLKPGDTTALSKLLSNLVIGDDTLRSPLEVLIDASADVNRPDATATPDQPLTADEDRDVFGDVQEFLYDQDQEKRSLERLYSVIQDRKVK